MTTHWGIENGEIPIPVPHKAAFFTLALIQVSRDVPTIVDAQAERSDRVGGVENGEIPIPVPHKAAIFALARVTEVSRDVPTGVDAKLYVYDALGASKTLKLCARAVAASPSTRAGRPSDITTSFI